MNEIIKSDLYRYSGSKGYLKFLILLFNPAFFYTYLYRKTSIYKKNTIRGSVYRLLKRHYGLLYGIQIPPTTNIGKGLFIGHVGNIIINPNSVIGNNCNIAQGVTIGEENRGKKRGTPIIGNEVWIGANSVIVGKIKIGNNVLIAPNCFINFDVPDNSIVVGARCSIHQNQMATEKYIEFKSVN